MPRPHSAQRPVVGGRVSLRRVLPGGDQGDLLGWVVAADAVIIVRDRRGTEHPVAWPDVLALRPVGVPRGRDPLRTPRAELDTLAAAAGVSGRAFVARLADLLDDLPPGPLGTVGEPPPCPASLAGEWVTAGDCADLVALAWWAARNDARSLQVRTTDASAVPGLLARGLVERPG